MSKFVHTDNFRSIEKCAIVKIWYVGILVLMGRYRLVSVPSASRV